MERRPVSVTQQNQARRGQGRQGLRAGRREGGCRRARTFRRARGRRGTARSLARLPRGSSAPQFEEPRDEAPVCSVPGFAPSHPSPVPGWYIYFMITFETRFKPDKGL